MSQFNLNHLNQSAFSHNLPGSDYYNYPQNNNYDRNYNINKNKEYNSIIINNNNNNQYQYNPHHQPNDNYNYNTDYNNHNNNHNHLHQLASSFFNNNQHSQIGTARGTSSELSGAGGASGSGSAGSGGGIGDIGSSGETGGTGGSGANPLGVGTIVGVVDYVPEDGALGGPKIVAMDQQGTQHQEAYYLFFVGSMGMLLNVLIVVVIFLRRPLRRMTSAFLVHASFLNFVKAAFCIPFGLNLLSDADASKGNQPPNCVVQGSSFIVLLTTSAFNMVAMICTEAYTFGETNVGGNSQGTTCCILFGIMVVYITAVILHLGPTLIGGEIVYNPDIGNCAFMLGDVTGYVANVMCIIIITFALVGVAHFLSKFYKEIQMNRPNRVSMLVRHSISLTADDDRQKDSVCAVHEMTQDAIHRAKIFVITGVAFVLCWYPLFILIVLDMNFAVSPKVYQAFCFIAWSHPLVEPIILIFFDRNLNILAKFMYCDQPYTASQIAYLLSQRRGDRSYRDPHQTTGELEDQSSLHHQGDIEDLTTTNATTNSPMAGGAGTLNSHNISMEIENAFQNINSAASKAAARSTTPRGRNGSSSSAPRERDLSPAYGTLNSTTSTNPRMGGGGGGGHNSLAAPPPPAICHHCHSPTTPHKIIASSSASPFDSSIPPHARSMSSSSGGGGPPGVSDLMLPVSTSSPRGDNLQGFQNFQPVPPHQVAGGDRAGDGRYYPSYGGGGGGGAGPGEGIEMNLTSLNQSGGSRSAHTYDPVCLKDADGNGGAHQGNIQC